MFNGFIRKSCRLSSLVNWLNHFRAAQLFILPPLTATLMWFGLFWRRGQIPGNFLNLFVHVRLVEFHVKGQP